MTSEKAQGLWQRLLWELVFPERLNRAEPTVSGSLLVILSFGIGLAAYNSSNNILFITLSLLLSSLLLSGLLSWANLRRVEARILSCGPSRAAEPSLVRVEAANASKTLPAYGVWVDLRAEPEADPEGHPFLKVHDSATRRALRKRLSSVGSLVFIGRIQLGRGLPQGEVLSEGWEWTPPKRGAWELRLTGLGSLFPFGFLRKQRALRVLKRIVVRPAPLRYELLSQDLAPRLGASGRRSRKGSGNDLISLRRYAAGDPHSLIHWKASARHRRLLVRENAEEAGSPLALWFEADPRLWPEAAQLERGVSLSATLAEDLFRLGRLGALKLGDEPWQRIRSEADLEAWLDRLACVRPGISRADAALPSRPGVPVITIRPEGPNGAAAHVDGRKIALA